MVEVEDLYKKYGEFTAVDHLNLTVADGEVLGFVGPNGAGKTCSGGWWQCKNIRY